MFEYLIIALLIFVPVSVVCSRLLRKQELDGTTVKVCWLVSLVLIITFPLVAAWLSLAAAVGVDLLVVLAVLAVITTPWKKGLAGVGQAVKTAPKDGPLEAAGCILEAGGALPAELVAEDEPEEAKISASTAPDEASEENREYDADVDGHIPAETVVEKVTPVGIRGEEEYPQETEPREDNTTEPVKSSGTVEPEIAPVHEEAVWADERLVSDVLKEAQLREEGDEETGSVPEVGAGIGILPVEEVEASEVNGSETADDMWTEKADETVPQPICGSPGELPEQETDFNLLIETGFAAKFNEDYEEAARQFRIAWENANEPDLIYILGMELANLYREIGWYDEALYVLGDLCADSRIGPIQAESVSREIEILTITRRLLQDIGMPDLPASRVPRLIRLKALEEFNGRNI